MIPESATRAVEKIKCDSAFIADIGSWHSLKNFSNKPAVALSIRVMPWSWEDFKTSGLPPIEGVTLG
jgi:mannose-6-phosphate isomerase-like protein (cupin superfamily)